LPGKKRPATTSQPQEAAENLQTDLQQAIRDAFKVMEKRLKKASCDM